MHRCYPAIQQEQTCLKSLKNRHPKQNHQVIIGLNLGDGKNEPALDLTFQKIHQLEGNVIFISIQL